MSGDVITRTGPYKVQPNTDHGPYVIKTLLSTGCLQKTKLRNKTYEWGQQEMKFKQIRQHENATNYVNIANFQTGCGTSRYF